MFTGIIEQTGTVVGIKQHGNVQRLTVSCPGIAGQLREGDSLAVSGVCLTALDVNPEFFHADLAVETLERTTLRLLQPGAKVNLELPTAAGAPLGGHIVQGHVDETGELIALVPLPSPSGSAPDPAATDWRLTLRVPPSLHPYMVPKGSVAVEGISLTIASTNIPTGGDQIEIAILPLTWSRTNLHTLPAGAPVNLEADILLKAAALRNRTDHSQVSESGLLSESGQISESWLVANGY